MAHWNPSTEVCVGCRDSYLYPLIASCDNASGAYVYWCPNCGTVLTTPHDEPISGTDWHVPATAFDPESHFRTPPRLPLKG